MRRAAADEGDSWHTEGIPGHIQSQGTASVERSSPCLAGHLPYKNPGWITPRPRSILQRGRPRAPTFPGGA